MLQAVLPEPWEDTPPPELMPAPPPTQDELPCDDGEPMETQRHKWQMDLLIETMDRWLAQRGEGYAGGNMFVYFDLGADPGPVFPGAGLFCRAGRTAGRAQVLGGVGRRERAGRDYRVIVPTYGRLRSGREEKNLPESAAGAGILLVRSL